MGYTGPISATRCKLMAANVMGNTMGIVNLGLTQGRRLDQTYWVLTVRVIIPVCFSSEWRWKSHQTCSGKYRAHVKMYVHV